MNIYGLQYFIEQNAGKIWGSRYIFGNLLIQTINRGKFVEVHCNLPWTTLIVPFDIFKMADHIAFHEWLCDFFVPEIKRLLKEEG